MELLARRYDTGCWTRLIWQRDRLVELETLTRHPATEDDLWVAPGLVDIQVNGYGGQEFASAELAAEHVRRIVQQHWGFGVTRLCPTLTTQSPEVFEHALRVIDQACREDPLVQASVAGVHLEGPFICREDGPRGAHPAEHCREPDWELFCRWQQAAGGRVRLMTLSPEYGQAPRFIRQAVLSSVRIAIGHTGATHKQILQAVDAGATLSTHLGNGAHRLLPRHPNYLWTQLGEDRLAASLIVDGHHLPPEVVRVFVRAKGVRRCVLVSDVSGLAGLPPGEYTSSGCQLEILPDGRLVIAGQRQLLAGASRPLGAGVVNVMQFAGVSLAEAVAMATENPCRVLGLRVDRLQVGAVADLVVFRLKSPWPEEPAAALEVVATVLGGQVVFGELPSG